jgi:hypothetical protein
MCKVVSIPVNRKAEYVKDAKFIGGHTCHWPGCQVEVKPALWGCSKHWFKLPTSLRNKIWATYQPGQEVTKTPSPEYIAVANEVQEWISANK